MSDKELLFSVTKKDFIIEPFKGSGAGGQHRNKTMSCIRMRHPDSGAEAIGTKHREQSRNKKEAFNMLVKSKKFQTWLKHEASKATQNIKEIEKKVDYSMREENLLIETGDLIC